MTLEELLTYCKLLEDGGTCDAMAQKAATLAKRLLRIRELILAHDELGRAMFGPKTAAEAREIVELLERDQRKKSETDKNKSRL